MADLILDLDGPVHAVDHGGAGPPMLLVHGLGGSLLDWRDVAPSLTRHHRVWSLDLIGFGRTPIENRHATVAANQRLVDVMVRHIGRGEPVLLMGNSMGGLISIVEASRRPDLISGLVLVDPALPRTRGGRLALMITAAFLVLAMPGVGEWLTQNHTRRRGAERLVDDVLELCTVDASRVNPATRAAQVELTRWRAELDDPHRAFVEASRSLTRWLLRRETLESHIRGVRAPTLLIHGESDRLVSVSAAGWAAALRPDWSLRVLADTGHVPQLERPREFVRLVEHWLDEVRPAAARPVHSTEPAAFTSRR
ncbi:MAG TPA: alpha/beta hydrolase [Candidatus Dormibacteraeota bacterium]